MSTKYIKVSVSERLPEAERHVFAFWNTGESGTVVINENGYWYSFEAQSECDQPDFWLEPVPDREDEMREMLEEITEAIEFESIIIKENIDNDGWENFGGRFYDRAKKLLNELK